MGITRPTRAGCEVVFQVCIARGGLGEGVKGLLREGRAPEIGMQDGSGGVDDTAERGTAVCRETAMQRLEEYIRGKRARFVAVFQDIAALVVELGTYGVCNPCSGMGLDERRGPGIAEQRVDLGELAEPFVCFHGHPEVEFEQSEPGYWIDGRDG